MFKVLLRLLEQFGNKLLIAGDYVLSKPVCLVGYGHGCDVFLSAVQIFLQFLSIDSFINESKITNYRKLVGEAFGSGSEDDVGAVETELLCEAVNGDSKVRKKGTIC